MCLSLRDFHRFGRRFSESSDRKNYTIYAKDTNHYADKSLKSDFQGTGKIRGSYGEGSEKIRASKPEDSFFIATSKPHPSRM